MVQQRLFDGVRGFLPVELRLGPAALAVLAGLLVAACGGGGTGCGGTGGSGYQVDTLPRPGLLNCSMGGSSSTGSTTPVDPGNATALDAAVAMSLNGTAMAYAAPLPTPGSTGTLAFVSPPNTVTSAMTVQYPLNAPSGLYVYCEIQGATTSFYALATTGASSNTLSVTYPTFSTTGNFTLACDGVGSGSGVTALATVTIAASP